MVIGAGLAGLTAGASAARRGAAVTVVDTRSPGGRARTDRRSGYLMNQGPHALYKRGPGRKVLVDLGVKPSGHRPRFRGSRGLADGQLAPLPFGPQGFLAGDRVGAQVAKALGRLAITDPSRWAGRSAQEWIDHLELRPAAAGLLQGLVRVTTYVADLDRLPADLALTQARSGLLGGVAYLDGGWQALVEGLLGACRDAGALVRSATAVHHVTGEPGAWQVVVGADQVLPASAVVVAAGGPQAAARLVPVPTDWEALGPQVTAACMDIGLRGPGAPFVVGIDQPLYLSTHCPPGDLTPKGGALVHAMRYGATGPDQDRRQLQHLAAVAGVRPHDVVTERFLAKMVVTHLLPSPQGGLAERPAVQVAGTEGLFVAGDWVGPTGWLADAALSSGHQAGALAAQWGRTWRAGASARRSDVAGTAGRSA